MSKWTQLMFLGTILVAGALDVRTAQAKEWRFCLAAVHSEHKIYLSAPFPTDKSMERLQDDFAYALGQAGFRHDDVQCPKGGEQSIAIMRAQAVRYNRESGNTIVEFDGWRP